MPNYTSIDGISGYINCKQVSILFAVLVNVQIERKVDIPNDLEQIKDNVYGNQVNTETTERGTLIENIGIAAAVKVCSDCGGRQLRY